MSANRRLFTTDLSWNWDLKTHQHVFSSSCQRLVSALLFVGHPFFVPPILLFLMLIQVLYNIRHPPFYAPYISLSDVLFQ